MTLQVSWGASGGADVYYLLVRTNWRQADIYLWQNCSHVVLHDTSSE